ENLAADLKAALAGVGIDPCSNLPHRNASRHDHFATYYTKEAEEAVYEKYKWAFDSGFYERLNVQDGPSAPAQYGQKLPIDGPVVQVGPSEGLWPDLRVSERLGFRIKATAAVSEMTVIGQVEPGDRAVSLTATLEGRSTRATHRGNFAWKV